MISFVDRMRYHWGLGIGHTYSHTQSTLMIQTHTEADNPGSQLPQKASSGNLEFKAVGGHTSHNDDLPECLANSLESGEFDSHPLITDRFSSDSDESDWDYDLPVEAELDSESELVLGDDADIDGWDTFNDPMEYKF